MFAVISTKITPDFQGHDNSLLPYRDHLAEPRFAIEMVSPSDALEEQTIPGAVGAEKSSVPASSSFTPNRILLFALFRPNVPPNMPLTKFVF